MFYIIFFCCRYSATFIITHVSFSSSSLQACIQQERGGGGGTKKKKCRRKERKDPPKTTTQNKQKQNNKHQQQLKYKLLVLFLGYTLSLQTLHPTPPPPSLSLSRQSVSQLAGQSEFFNQCHFPIGIQLSLVYDLKKEIVF